MSKNINKIDKYLKGVIPPEHVSYQHRQKLRREVLDEIERKQTMPDKIRFWKIAAVLALVIFAGTIATAVGIKIYRYRFEGQDSNGVYHFSTEPEIIYDRTYTDANGTAKGIVISRSRSVTLGSANTADVEQAQRDLEELDLLRRQDARELVGVIEIEVNGHFDRTFQYNYTLSDGRSITMGEGDNDDNKPVDPAQIEKVHKEIDQLRKKGERQLTRVIDTLVDGELQRTCIYKYILADGREKTRGESDPELIPPEKILNSEQTQEIWRLRQLKEGDFLGFQDKQVHGITFSFETYNLTLSDGTIVTHSIGTPKGQFKTNLTEADWEEFRHLRQTEEGEYLGTEEKVVKGRTFTFKRERFILSDGTEVVWSVGELK